MNNGTKTRAVIATVLLLLITAARTECFFLPISSTSYRVLTLRGGADAAGPRSRGVPAPTRLPLSAPGAPSGGERVAPPRTQPPVLPLATIVLACTRTIPAGDRLFSLLFPLYVCLANRWRFDRNAPVVAAGGTDRPLLREGSGPWFKTYILTFGVVGIVLPLALQVLAPRPVAEAAAPHLYLTLCQVVMETVARKARYHPVPRLLVPIGFNAYRLTALGTWVRTARGAAPRGAGEVAGLVLAVANALLWTYNLFVFLLLRTLPQYLDRREFPEAEVSWKGQLLPVIKRD